MTTFSSMLKANVKFEESFVCVLQDMDMSQHLSVKDKNWQTTEMPESRTVQLFSEKGEKTQGISCCKRLYQQIDGFFNSRGFIRALWCAFLYAFKSRKRKGTVFIKAQAQAHVDQSWGGVGGRGLFKEVGCEDGGGGNRAGMWRWMWAEGRLEHWEMEMQIAVGSSSGLWRETRGELVGAREEMR